jgi:hypothetical protein
VNFLRLYPLNLLKNPPFAEVKEVFTSFSVDKHSLSPKSFLSRGGRVFVPEFIRLSRP